MTVSKELEITYFFHDFSTSQKLELINRYSRKYIAPENQVLICLQSMKFLFSSVDSNYCLEPQEELLFKSYFAQ